MGFPDSFGKAFFIFWDGNQMNVIVHKAIGYVGNSRPIAILFQKTEIKDFIFFFEKDFLPTIPSLDDMVRTIRDDKTSNSRHL